MRTEDPPGSAAQSPPNRGKGSNSVSHCRYFTHHLTGKVYDAYDYGHRSWPIGKSGL